MSCFLFTDDSDNVENVNIDELYEKRQQRDLRQVSIFNKILNRIHKRIKVTGRNKANDQHIWFTIPEYIFGEPVYDKAECIAYVIAKLETNKFHIRYIHPNTLFVSWSNWIPSYVRSEYKKRTGVAVDELGQVIEKKNEMIVEETNPNTDILNLQNQGSVQDKQKKTYNSTDNYVPTGKLIYNPDMFNHINKKVN